MKKFPAAGERPCRQCSTRTNRQEKPRKELSFGALCGGLFRPAP
nr:MAG TPA: hypothetical protein [Caudoviricetes sp.]